MLRAHTIEGVFCDPLHGGNVGLVGWQLVGFPGPLMGRKPVSLQEVVGSSVQGWEDEKD